MGLGRVKPAECREAEPFPARNRPSGALPKI